MDKYALYDSPFGTFQIGYSPAGIFQTKQHHLLKKENQPGPLSDLAFAQIKEYLAGQRQEFDLPLDLRGTDFQKRVWQELMRIPYGQTRTYKEVAIAAQSPRGSRAVGMANHNNPLMIIVPCHRVIGSSGALTGYAGGLTMKQALLELEQKQL